MEKPRLHLRLSPKIHAQLMAARGPNVTTAAIVEAALTAYFDPVKAEGREKAVLERFDQFDLRQAEIEKELAVAAEVLGQFVLYWLTATPPLAESERKTAHALGQRRFDRFIDQVARKISADHSFSARVFKGLFDDLRDRGPSDVSIGEGRLDG